MSEEYWANLLAVFLHDPPDKALRISDHEARAEEYLKTALGDKTPSSYGDLRKKPDVEASKLERLPMPYRTRDGKILYDPVEPAAGGLSICHPLSGEKISLGDCVLNEDRRAAVNKAIEEIVGVEDDPKKLFFLLWRLLPGSLAPKSGDQVFLHLPAETRAPDHTIWSHLDTAAAFYPTYLTEEAKKDAALLSFHLGPVQEFIATARSLRDLWTGSMILSWLTFSAMKPVFDEYGPTSFIYPALRGLPFMDLWMLEKVGERADLRREISSKEPCVPNKFLAVVPAAEAIKLAEECEKTAKDEWKKIAAEVREKLNPELSNRHDQWDVRWNEQIDDFFDVKTSVLPILNDEKEICAPFGKDSPADLYPNVKAIRELFAKIGSRYKLATGTWQGLVELSARLMEARRAIRHVPGDTKANGDVPPKCTMMGSYEQMGPAGLKELAEFWENAAQRINIGGVRLRKSERLCAISLVKRFAEPVYFQGKLDLKVKFHDTATVAARPWLKETNLDPEDYNFWSGQWLHWPRRDPENDDPCPHDTWEAIKVARKSGKEKEIGERPPSYYAILAMDADHMGKWLRGEFAPPVEKVYHESILEYIKGEVDADTYEKFLKAKRPLGPAAHMAMSEALTNFAVHVTPRIVEKHHGQLIYAGGDDVLAFLPVESAVQCARELYDAFRDDEAGFNNNAKHPGYYRVEYKDKNGAMRSRDMVMMEPKATLSAGIAVVHYKKDLRLALDSARKAEKAAKNSGRDILQLAVDRRSGEHATALVPWDMTGRFNDWVEAFKNGASDRWVYHLRQELETLKALPEDAIRAEIKRLVNRSEKETREKFGEREYEENGRKVKKSAGKIVADAFTDYRKALEAQNSKKPENSREKDQEKLRASALEQFITLLQSASFFARGRD